tara:strand:+ start:452 stop:700 length:249 start_codon:yes stop_codon:yes gene_type:complete
MRYTIKLPQDQQDIVVDALRIYKETIESLCPANDDGINDKHFDLQGLIGIFSDKDIEVRIEMGERVHNSFIGRGHNVDFPIY